MNNRGFTLVELLATIFVLAIITTIGITSYTRVSNAIKKEQRNNKIKRIEEAATKYAFDTGKTVVFVDTLVVNGYIDSDYIDNDTERGMVSDPLGNNNMNCYAVHMEKKGSYYTATFDNNSYNNNGLCDINALYNNYTKIKLSVKQNGIDITNTNTWLNGTINITASSENMDLNCNDNDCKWNSTSGLNIDHGNNYITISNDNIENETTYTFSYRVNVNGEINSYSDSISLKIDNVAPRIDYININDDKSITLMINEKGSLNVSVCINNSESEANCEWEDANVGNYKTSSKIIEGINNYIHVKDKVGNINSELINTT